MSDFVVVLTGLAMFWIDSARGYVPYLERVPYLLIQTLPIAFFSQFCSTYFIVTGAIDCYIKACWSTRWPSYATPRSALNVVGLVVAVSAVYTCPRFGQFYLHECLVDAQLDERMVEICPTQFYEQVNVVYNVYLSMVFMTFLPFVLLCILNTLIIKAVERRWRSKTMSLVTALSVNIAMGAEVSAERSRHLDTDSHWRCDRPTHSRTRSRRRRSQTRPPSPPRTTRATWTTRSR